MTVSPADIFEAVARSVDATLHPHEVESVRVTLTHGANDTNREATIELIAVGETFEWHFSTTEFGDRAELGAALSSHLRDFVSESRFGWGEQR